MGRILLSMPFLLLALLGGGANFADAQVTVPNTFTDGEVADAEAMNANFETVQDGLNLALTSADVTGLYQFENGKMADADEVNANFTALDDGVNTALSNRETDCVAAAGGTWDAETSTCTPGARYNCFVGAFCAEMALLGWVIAPDNAYDGDTQETPRASDAGCNESPGSDQWSFGESVGDTSDSPFWDWAAAPWGRFKLCQ